MKRSASGYGIFALAVVLLLALSTFVPIELIERRKFNALRQEIEAALQDFQQRAAAPRPKLADPDSTSENGRDRLVWHVFKLSWSTNAGGNPTTDSACMVWLTQRRTVILRSPEIAVLWPMDPDRNLEQILDAALKARGLTYDRGFVLE